jgi:hypothetical protein
MKRNLNWILLAAVTIVAIVGIFLPSPSFRFGALPTPYQSVGISGSLISGRVPFANGSSTVNTSANLSYTDAAGGTLTTGTFSGTVNATSITDSGLTSGRDVVTTTGGLLADKVISGSTFPASPKTGDSFLHSVTGRKILYQYNGSSWDAIKSFGVIYLYVDGADGTDDLNHGTAADSAAFATVQYAWNSIPKVNDGVYMYIAAGTYNENLILNQRKGENINIIGTLSSSYNGTATGGAQGSGTTPPRISGSFTANQYDNKLVKFTSGSNNGLYRIISLTTTTNLYLNGWALNAAPQNGDTYTIYNWGTVINGFQQICSGQMGVVLDSLSFTASSGVYELVVWGSSEVVLQNSKVSSSGSSFAFCVGNESVAFVRNCLLQTTATSVFCVEVEDHGHFEPMGVKILGADISNSTGLRINRSYLNSFGGCEIDAFTWNVNLMNGSEADFEAPSGMVSYIHGAGAYGIYATQHSGASNTGTSHITFGKKLDGTTDSNVSGNTSADATSYSWIGN